MQLQLVFLFVVFTGISVHGYRILGVFPCISYSHYTLGFRLMKELVDRGHEVVFINSHPQKKPIQNFTDISVEEIKKPVKDFITQLSDFGTYSYFRQLLWMVEYGKVMSESTFKTAAVQDLMNSDEKFDLVIVEHFINEAMWIFAHKFKCPQVVVAPGPTSVFNNHLFANPSSPAYVANLLSNYDPNMNFWQRLDNIYREVVGQLITHFGMIPTQDAVLQKAFPGSPALSSILYNSSLMLVLSDPSLDDPVPLQQSIKPVGGYHVPPPKPLPKELQDFMDNSTEGVVVFSMGSNLKSANFEQDKREAILKAFSKIKHKVLWKFETDLPEKPDNVRISSWLPQSDILAHPNTVAFISHGGLLGTTEAISYGVPILGLPVFWDQEHNIEAAVRKGVAVKVNFHLLGEKNFKNALKEILNNPKYRQEARKRSAIMHDRLIKSLDEAIFWIEYAIRHKGSPHLRSAAVSLSWYQLYLLDIILFIIIISFIIYIGICLVISYFYSWNSRITKNKKNM